MGSKSQISVLTEKKKIRLATEKQHGLKEALIYSLDPTLAQLKHRFSQLQLHGESVCVHDAANDDEMHLYAEILDLFSEDDTSDIFSKLGKKKDSSKYKKLEDFMKQHFRERQYTFQIKKCAGDCWYCTVNPPRLPSEQFTTLDWLPDPTLDADKNGYLSFGELYGKETNDSARPSAQNTEQASENDKKNKHLMVAGKVQCFIICGDCGKRRVVYCGQRLTVEMIRVSDRCQEELDYTCGSPLLPDGHKFSDILVVKEGLNCQSNIETTYYAGVTQKFTVCYFCGDTEVLLDANEVIADKKRRFSIVRPLCLTSLGKGREPATRNALNVGGNKRK